jgi:glycosyltransferase involved in cell wall biosynthesis
MSVRRNPGGFHIPVVAHDRADPLAKKLSIWGGIIVMPPASESDSSAPLVTVAIPTRNRPELLAEAIRSVQANTLKHLEICVSDDGDKKLGAEYFRQFNDPRIKYRAHDRTGKVHDNWDSSCRLGSAPYVFKLDDDDTIEPEFLERTVAFLEARPEVSVVYTGYTILFDKSDYQVVDRHFFGTRGMVSGFEYARAILLNENYPWNHKSAGVFRRKKAESIEWFRYAKMDVTFSIALALDSHIGYLPETLFNYNRKGAYGGTQVEGMKPSVYESILVDFNQLFAWPFVIRNKELMAIQSLALSRIQFAVPLLYLARSVRSDPVSVVREKWQITRRNVKLKRTWLLWTLIIMVSLLPVSWLSWLLDWYARTGWVKKMLNFCMPR